MFQHEIYFFFNKLGPIHMTDLLLKLPRVTKTFLFSFCEDGRRRKKIMFVKTEKFFGQFCGYTQSLSFLRN